MTVQDFFDHLSGQPLAVFTFLLMVPISSLLTNFLSGSSGGRSPWKYLYSLLIYLACIPGIFALTLLFYLFLFENINILELDIILNILPPVSMIATILIIRKNVNLDLIPGFDKITAFLTIILVVFIFLWILDRTRLWVVTFLPLSAALLIFFLLLAALLWGWHRIKS